MHPTNSFFAARDHTLEMCSTSRRPQQTCGSRGWRLAPVRVKPGTDVKTVVDAAQAEIAKVAEAGIPAPELSRVKSKMRADFYSGIELPINRADSLALAQLVLGDANAINTIPGQIDTVSVADLKRVAAKYLTVANRTVIDRKPAPAAEAKGE